MSHELDKIEFSDGAKLRIIQDESPESPREWDNLATMVMLHKLYNLGDKHHYSDFDSWDALKAQIESTHDVEVILPVRMYDHSGIALSTGSGYPFNCPWDSVMVGFIFVTSESIKSCFGDVTIDDEFRSKITQQMQGELETYNQYLAGDVWGFILEIPKPACETCGHVEYEEDSCWGFYGSDPLENGMADHFPEKYREELKSR